MGSILEEFDNGQNWECISRSTSIWLQIKNGFEWAQCISRSTSIWLQILLQRDNSNKIKMDLNETWNRSSFEYSLGRIGALVAVCTDDLCK